MFNALKVSVMYFRWTMCDSLCNAEQMFTSDVKLSFECIVNVSLVKPRLLFSRCEC